MKIPHRIASNFISRLYEARELTKVPQIECNADNLYSIGPMESWRQLANTDQHLLDLSCIAQIVLLLQPSRVFEVGTFEGASAITIGASMEANGNAELLVSVDIEPSLCNVATKYSRTRPWIKFFTISSLEFLRNLGGLYELVFLDGDHSAKTVYQELCYSLNVLDPDGGFILLHDYFPRGKPIPGPYLALKRLIREHPEIEVIPLYPIFNSHMALVVKR